MAPFLNDIREAVVPLVRDFDLGEAEAREEPLRALIRLANRPARVGIEFRIDWADLKVFVTLFRLTTAGEFSDFYAPGQSLEERSAYNADDLLLLRDPESEVPHRGLRRKAAGEARSILDMYVEDLREHASDVLGGDFRVFEDLRAVVAGRSARLKSRDGDV